MANIFNIAEIVEMGIEKERMRRDFYDLCSKTFTDEAVRSLFSRLKAWEEEHIARFKEIGSKIKDPSISETYEGEFKVYMDAVIDDLIYKKVTGGEFLKNVKTPLDAIRYGISFEKDAILFFRELSDYYSGPGKDRIAELVEEEKKHILYLTELKRKLAV